MSSSFETLKNDLVRSPKSWLVTGAAGFIGSNLVETLLKLGQNVVGFDNFSTGKAANLEDIRSSVTSAEWQRFRFIEGDLQDLTACLSAATGADYILHQAALGSVPRSIAEPVRTHDSNVTGTMNILLAARDARVRRIVFASSSSVYGDHPVLPKVEENLGRLLSPYALTKYANELYAEVFGRVYGVESVGLRYFNVFGRRQDPDGAYAAVIPKWIAALIRGENIQINGTGETSRDFCYVANAVQANLLAATATRPEAVGKVYNVAVGTRTDLNELFQKIKMALAGRFEHVQSAMPEYRDFREGDIMHSLADIAKAKTLLGYDPTHTLDQGLSEALAWYIANLS